MPSPHTSMPIGFSISPLKAETSSAPSAPSSTRWSHDRVQVIIWTPAAVFLLLDGNWGQALILTLWGTVVVGTIDNLLGPILVGPRARVGANAVVTRDVPEGAVMVGIPARATMVEGGAAATPARFVPYGTPCSEMFDPATQKLEIMRCELDTMRKRLDELMAEREEHREVAHQAARNAADRINAMQCGRVELQ